MKQTAHLYYWFRVTTVFLDDFCGMALFQPVCVVLCPEKYPEILKFSYPEKIYRDQARKNAEMKTLMLSLCLRWRTRICQQLLSNAVPTTMQNNALSS